MKKTTFILFVYFTILPLGTDINVQLSSHCINTRCHRPKQTKDCEQTITHSH